jgi:hypothetical protein
MLITLQGSVKLQLGFKPVVVDIRICPLGHNLTVELTAESHRWTNDVTKLNITVKK